MRTKLRQIEVRGATPAESPLLRVALTANDDSLHRKKIEELEPRGPFAC
jgi:hypothetical protein